MMQNLLYEVVWRDEIMLNIEGILTKCKKTLIKVKRSTM